MHGFTGTPMSVRNIAEALAADGYDVELPRLPGHGTTIDEMQTTSWRDWAGEAEAALMASSGRATSISFLRVGLVMDAEERGTRGGKGRTAGKRAA